MNIHEELQAISQFVKVETPMETLKQGLKLFEQGMAKIWQDRLQIDHTNHIKATNQEPIPGPISAHGRRLGMAVAKELNEPLQSIMFLGAKGVKRFLEALQKEQMIIKTPYLFGIEPRTRYQEEFQNLEITLFPSKPTDALSSIRINEIERVSSLLAMQFWSSAARVVICAKVQELLMPGGSLDIVMTGAPEHGDGLTMACDAMRKTLGQKGIPLNKDTFKEAASGMIANPEKIKEALLTLGFSEVSCDKSFFNKVRLEGATDVTIKALRKDEQKAKILFNLTDQSVPFEIFHGSAMPIFRRKGAGAMELLSGIPEEHHELAKAMIILELAKINIERFPEAKTAEEVGEHIALTRITTHK